MLLENVGILNINQKSCFLGQLSQNLTIRICLHQSLLEYLKFHLHKRKLYFDIIKSFHNGKKF